MFPEPEPVEEEDLYLESSNISSHMPEGREDILLRDYAEKFR